MEKGNPLSWLKFVKGELYGEDSRSMFAELVFDFRVRLHATAPEKSELNILSRSITQTVLEANRALFIDSERLKADLVGTAIIFVRFVNGGVKVDVADFTNVSLERATVPLSALL